MRLYPLPSLQLLNVQGRPSSHSHSRELVTSNKWLFMVDHLSARTIVKHELDFTKMEWVMREDLGEETLFISYLKCSSVVETLPTGEAMGKLIVTALTPLLQEKLIPGTFLGNVTTGIFLKTRSR